MRSYVSVMGLYLLFITCLIVGAPGGVQGEETVLRELNVGETAEVAVAAKEYWNHSGLLLKKGEHNDLEVPGNQTWWDAGNQSGADGYSTWKLAPFAILRRYVSEKWFVLVGTIDYKKAFVIGRQLKGFTPELDGELTCYANDARGFYGNNRGELLLKVTRID